MCFFNSNASPQGPGRLERRVRQKGQPPDVDSSHLKLLREAIDTRVLSSGIGDKQVKLFGECPLALWVYLGWHLSAHKEDVTVTSAPVSAKLGKPCAPVSVEHTVIDSERDMGFVSERVVISPDDPFNFSIISQGTPDFKFATCATTKPLIFVRRLKLHCVTPEQVEAMESKMGDGFKFTHVIYVTLNEGKATIADSVEMAKWCRSVELCVRGAVESLPALPDKVGVVIAGPSHIAFATGRGLAGVSHRGAGKVPGEFEVLAADNVVVFEYAKKTALKNTAVVMEHVKGFSLGSDSPIIR